ncbi:MAG: gliding motility-associated C-terminal domain-containing protein [Bacteroidales bacterium]|nr:gliding motility-associated C-terminal domain-containing protein [Bacteroidales bacterium]
MYRKRKYILTLFFALAFLFVDAQHEADFWYFGNYAGLDFSSGNPEPLTDGQLENKEGCAVASDSAGNLLFYTNGVTVWNKEHQIMENGSGLFGDSSSTQSAIMVPHPGNDSLYFIFTTDVLRKHLFPNYHHKGLNYSLVNIKKNNCMGEIIEKNTLILDSVCEKITAVRHQNGKDIWVITHEWGSDAYYVWLIDETGFNSTPVISNVGFIFIDEKVYAVGYLKPDTDGEKLISAILYAQIYEIFDFDKSTGLITNPFTISIGNTSYGCEFSPNVAKLYMTDYKTLYQVDMNAGTPDDIINSLTEIHEFTSSVGALQLAKNGKLYITNDNSEYLSVINNPNELPADCNFELNAVYLEGRIARLGLPNFIQSYFKEPDFRIENFCVFDETQFFIENITDIDSVIWNFDDPASGSMNISRELSPVHIFSEPGIYNVTLTVWFNNVSTDHSENIKIVALPVVNLGNDTTFCTEESYIIDACSSHINYLWNDMSTDSVLYVDTTGTYWVNVENIYTNCKNSDTINIVFSDIPEIDLGNDTIFCENTSFLIDTYNDAYTYLWQDNSTESYFSADDEGTYFVIVTNEDGCTNSDTISLSFKYIPRFSFPAADTLLCEGIVLNLIYNFEDAEYLWQDGSTDNSFLITEEGTYKLTTENICGTWSDSMNVEYHYCGDIYIPNIFSPNIDGINDLFLIKGIEEEDWKLIIYNRWGQEVRHYDSYDNTWDGKDMFGKDLAHSVYYYILSNIKSGELYKGTVRIVR